jgi:multimeric flavodoxin WrbA
MKTLLLVYHSQSGTTEALVKSAVAGAVADGEVKVLVKRAVDADTADLAGADGLILAAAENSGRLAGGMKEFLDRSFYPFQDGRLLSASLLISAGNDGRNAEADFRRILTGMPVKLVSEPLIVRGLPGPDDLDSCEELGATMAAGLAMGIF